MYQINQDGKDRTNANQDQPETKPKFKQRLNKDDHHTNTDPTLNKQSTNKIVKVKQSIMH